MIKYWKKILFAVGMALYLSGIFVNVVADPDLWGYLAFGRLFWETLQFPYHDVFSYIPTNTLWVYHEWLTGVILYPVYTWLGGTGLQILRYVIIFITIGLVFLTAQKRGGKLTASAIILFLAVNALTYGYSPVRAQVFTYLFFAALLYILEQCRKEQKFILLWWLLPVYLIWCNVHGGFVAGMGITVLYAIGEGLSKRQFLPYILILMASLITTLINPYGIDYWLYTAAAVSMPRPDIIEWLSLPAAMKAGKFIEFGSLFIFFFAIFILLVIRHRNRSLTDILVLTVTALLGFMHIRHSIFFFLAFGAYTPSILSDIFKTSETKESKGYSRLLVRYSLVFATLCFVLLAIFSFMKFILTPSLNLAIPSSYYPVGAIQWINNNQWRGNILPHFDWGEFIMWNCHPGCRVAMDGRFETVYRKTDYEEYFDFLHGRRDWNRFLERYPHDMVLIRLNTKTDALMRRHPGWQLTYEDAACSLFLKKKDDRLKYCVSIRKDYINNAVNAFYFVKKGLMI